jgi:hypothetical protein
MPIEFQCTGCQQQLRVPDTSAGKSAKCPKCSTIVVVPSALGGPLPGLSSQQSPVQPPQSPFGEMTKPAASGSPFADKPGGSAGSYAPGGGFGGGGGAANPYASPAAANYVPPVTGGAIGNVPVSVEQIFNYAWQIWQANLGLLVGVTLVVAVMTNGVSYLFQGIEFALQENDAAEAAIAVGGLRIILGLVIETFLTAGETIIVLKLVRRQPAEFSDLFSGGPIFLPLLGFSILYGLAVTLGFVLLIVPGILLLLMWWPAYYLVLERKAGVIDSFSVVQTITKNNWGTAFVMALLSFGIMLLGLLALCIGVLFAAPLVSAMWATAYLMMSGQLSPYGQQQLPSQFGGQPTPGKW